VISFGPENDRFVCGEVESRPSGVALPIVEKINELFAIDAMAREQSLSLEARQVCLIDLRFWSLSFCG
jgi:hypothetical protein